MGSCYWAEPSAPYGRTLVGAKNYWGGPAPNLRDLAAAAVHPGLVRNIIEKLGDRDVVYWVKKLSSALPIRVQQNLKRLHFARQIRSGCFVTSEPEFARLADWVAGGDWVIDVGANVGHYTAYLSRLVGPAGRVLAFEPVPQTFELLAANMAAAGAQNVSLFNVAASTQLGSAAISMPRFASGLTNYYMAGITTGEGEFCVLTMPIDNVMPAEKITLIKIDVEGHELQVIRGMDQLLRRDRPKLIVEGVSQEVEALLKKYGYSFMEYPGSPNRVFSPSAAV